MSLTAMFVFGGYRDELRKQEELSSFGQNPTAMINETFCGGGELEAAMLIGEIATDIDRELADRDEAQDGPGVWYYDVAEELGGWIARAALSGVRVETKEVVAKAIEMTVEWLREVNQ